MTYKCKLCGLERIKRRDNDWSGEGPDACLGYLPFVVSACCGHDNPSRAFIMIQNPNKSCLKLPKGFPISIKSIVFRPYPEELFEITDSWLPSINSLDALTVHVKKDNFDNLVKDLKCNIYKTFEDFQSSIFKYTEGDVLSGLENNTLISYKIVKRPMDKTCNPWEQDDRWDIVDYITGEVIDDAQGYGYKSPQKAEKAGWWKFRGGKIRTNNEEKIVKLWMSNNAKYVEEYENIVICNFKDLPSKNELVEMLYLKTGIRIPSTSYFKYFT